jgi:hypothetical protein
MPGELKALVHISVWVLFIFAWVMLINTIIQSWFYDLGAEMTMAGGSIAMVSFFLTAVAARLRQNLE